MARRRRHRPASSQPPVVPEPVIREVEALTEIEDAEVREVLGPEHEIAATRPRAALPAVRASESDPSELPDAKVVQASDEPERPLSERRDTQQDGDPELVQPEPTKAVTSTRAVLTGDRKQSLVSDKLSDKVDELDELFSTMGDIEPGQVAVVQLTLRTSDHWRGEMQAELEALRKGEPVQTKGTKTRSIFGGLMGGLKVAGYFASLFSYHTFSDGAKGKTPPLSPWAKKKRTGSKAKSDLPPPMSDEDKRFYRAAQSKVQSPRHYETRIRASVISDLRDYDEFGATDLRDRMAQAISSAYENEYQGLAWEPCDGREVFGYHPPRYDNDPILSPAELAELARPLDDATRPHRVIVSRTTQRDIRPRKALSRVHDMNSLTAQPGLIPMWQLNKGDDDEYVAGLTNADADKLLDRHLAIFGTTGSGKSAQLEWLTYGLIKNTKDPLIVVAPGKDLADNILSIIIKYAPERLDDVVMLDPGDEQYSLAINPLDISSQSEVGPATDGVMQLFTTTGINSQAAPRASVFIKQATIALLELTLALKKAGRPERPTLLNIAHFFTDAEFRANVVEFTDNAAVQETFGPEDNSTYNAISDAERNSTNAPILRGLATLATDDVFARVFSSPHNSIDFADLVAQGKIILMTTGAFSGAAPLGLFLGSLILPSLDKGMDRFGKGREQRRKGSTETGARAIFDEAPALFRNLDTGELTNGLAQWRKFGLGLVLAGQYPDQFGDASVERAIYGNTGTKIALKLSPNVAGPLSKDIGLKPDDIGQLPNYHGYVHTPIHGTFSVETLPPPCLFFDGITESDGGYDLTGSEADIYRQVTARSHEHYYNSAPKMQQLRKLLKDGLTNAMIAMLRDQNEREAARITKKGIDGDISLALDADYSPGPDKGVDWRAHEDSARTLPENDTLRLDDILGPMSETDSSSLPLDEPPEDDELVWPDDGDDPLADLADDLAD